jgi:hypothetical protein
MPVVSGPLAGARGVRAVPAVGVWRRPPLVDLALPRQATQCHVGVLSAASDPSIHGQVGLREKWLYFSYTQRRREGVW